MSITVTLPKEREEVLDELTEYYRYDSVDRYVSDLILYDVRTEQLKMNKQLLSKKFREEIRRREQAENEKLRAETECSFCGGEYSPATPRGLFKGKTIDICTNCLTKFVVLLEENDLAQID